MSSTRVGFSTSTTNILSRVIRWFTKSRVSHAFLVYYDQDWSRDMVLEATLGGFKVVPFDKFRQSTTVVAVFEPKHSVEAGLKEAVEWLGTDYDYTGLFGMIFVVMGRWFRLKWRNPWASSKAMFCSEAVARVLRGAGYPNTETMVIEETTPEDLLVFFEKE